MNLKADILVVGGGPAGACAAIAAARRGADVILVEKGGFCGGMATQASVPAFSPYSDGRDLISKGLALEIKDRMLGLQPDLTVSDRDWQPIDPEALKTVYDDLLQEAGVRVLYHTLLSQVIREVNQVKEVILEAMCGRIRVAADYFIDCSGNADLIAQTGVQSAFGDEYKKVQALTLCFRLGRVDTDRFRDYMNETGDGGNLKLAVAKAKVNHDFDIDEHHVAGAIIQNDGIVGMNFGHEYDINPLDPFELSRAEMEARRKIPKLVTFLKKYVPGFEQAIVISSGPSIGIRETRRIIGHKSLVEEDYYKRNIPQDVIAVSAYPIDVHSGTFNDSEAGKNEEYYRSRYDIGEYYGIPYGALVPKALDNVGVAGRILSADRKTHGSARLMNTCQLTGQAIGTAAALLSGSGKRFIELDIHRLQEALREDGGFIPTRQVANIEG